MKPARSRPQARKDCREQVRYYRDVAGANVAERLAGALRKALEEIELNPGIGSPVLGKALGIEGMRTWRLSDFPLVLIYIERSDHLDFVRLLGERQDIEDMIGDDC